MLKPVYALVGEDLFLQLEQLKELLKSAPADIQRIDVDGETAELGNVMDELVSFAMFSSAKMVVMRSGDEFIKRFREPLEKQLVSAKVPAGSSLILRLSSLPKNQRIYKVIVSLGQVIECIPPKQQDLPRWIIGRAKQAHQLQMGAPEANLLAELVGNDLGRLDNELAKLAIQCNGRADAASITQSVSFQREQEMWNMTDEVAAGRTQEAMKRWRQLVQSDSSAEFRAMTWLTMWLEKARRAITMRKAGQRDDAIASTLKIFPFEKRAGFFKTLNALGEDGVKRMIDLLAELDYRSKNGLGDMSENVERFILAGREGGR